MKGRKQHCSTVTRKALASPVGNSQLDGPLKLFTLRQGDWWVFISLLPPPTPIPVLTSHLDVQHLLLPYPRHNLGQGSSFGQGQYTKESAMSLSSWGHLGDVVQCPSPLESLGV